MGRCGGVCVRWGQAWRRAGRGTACGMGAVGVLHALEGLWLRSGLVWGGACSSKSLSDDSEVVLGLGTERSFATASPVLAARGAVWMQLGGSAALKVANTHFARQSTTYKALLVTPLPARTLTPASCKPNNAPPRRGVPCV